MGDANTTLVSSIAQTLSQHGHEFSVVLGRLAINSLVGEPDKLDWIVSLKSFLAKTSVNTIVCSELSKRERAVFSTFALVTEGLTDVDQRSRVITVSDVLDKTQTLFLSEHFSIRGLLVFDVDPEQDRNVFNAIKHAKQGCWSTYWFYSGKVSSEVLELFEAERAVPISAESIEGSLNQISKVLKRKPRETVPTTGPEVVPTEVPDNEEIIPEPKTIVNVLSIDGGGIRGVIPAIFLEELEQRTGKRIVELFDLIIGTSTGAILAMGVTCPGETGVTPKHSAQELARLYLDHGEVIFPPKSRVSWLVSLAIWTMQTKLFKWLGNILDKTLKTPYSSKGLEDVSEKFFGKTTRMADLLGEVIITTYELESRNTRLFSQRTAKANEGRNFTLIQAVRATSAAPSYFKPLTISQPHAVPSDVSFVDCGMFANNPAFCGLVEAKRIFGAEKDVVIVSLGTGEAPAPVCGKQAARWFSGQWVEHIVDLLMHGTSQITHKNLDRLFAHQTGQLRRYYRFQPNLSNCEKSLDAAAKTNVNRLANIARNYIENDHASDFEELVAYLTVDPTP